ncbi:ZIP family metal transporter [Streptomyces sp. SL13]|uniref:ZIP family metal transporter n=1 Tax=Streptantibioticus silvisoli TaxID=2705255 RepID=A0AA90H8N0_9ACTN|nr:ZIP family metal transporter [Streptantibioticus silvisoli]MDI5967385.1 ZIP family metal transporter [Streptantibioticus silvisoli]MDI5973941.1 ZIP family metal transporter [Streptantibioticus silvisoli]
MAALIAAGAFVMTLVGGIVAHRVGDRRHLVLGLAAGLMLGVVGFDLLPEALRAQPRHVFGVPAALATFLAGFLAVHVVERSVAVHRAHEGEYAAHRHAHDRPHRDGHDEPGLGLAAACALIAHSLLDGFAIGAAFQAGSTVGTVVAIAVIAHDFADGFNTYTLTRLYGNARRRAFALLLCDAVAPVVGAAVTLAFTIPAGVLGLYLGFFAGFLLYLATSDILPEAHSPHSSLPTLLCTVVGTGFMWLVIGLAG